jgi:hypothetical protein
MDDHSPGNDARQLRQKKGRAGPEVVRGAPQTLQSWLLIDAQDTRSGAS